jgi:hypothetical protein
LQADKTASTSLIKSYNTFVNETTNIIGGSSTGSGIQDGTNATIISHTLPSKYDFPALISSVENLLFLSGVKVNSIGGTDTSVATLGTATPTVPTNSATASAPVPIPFNFTVEGPYTTIQTCIATLQSSIRPIQINSITFEGNDTDLIMTVDAQTYYLPTTGLSITTKEVK